MGVITHAGGYLYVSGLHPDTEASGVRRIHSRWRGPDISLPESVQRRDASIRVEASKTALNERVQAHIKALRQDKATAVKSQEKVRKSLVLERLRDEALDLENPPSTRVRALELLGKSSGLFDDSTTVTIENRTPEQIELELQDKLAALFGNSKAKDN